MTNHIKIISDTITQSGAVNHRDRIEIYNSLSAQLIGALAGSGLSKKQVEEELERYQHAVAQVEEGYGGKVIKDTSEDTLGIFSSLFKKIAYGLSLTAFGYALYYGYMHYSDWFGGQASSESSTILKMECDGGPRLVEWFKPNGELLRYEMKASAQYLVEVEKSIDQLPLFAYSQHGGVISNMCTGTNPISTCFSDISAERVRYKIKHFKSENDSKMDDSYGFREVDLNLMDGTLLMQYMRFDMEGRMDLRSAEVLSCTMLNAEVDDA
ncbi:hypothetical protein [Amphritea sp.]|uniref:hypothetical protein n=1 Tax=Amphritea sp. TaxID=1872502 RepID=UPI0025BA2A4A|nr:hypothetical protein [Amphritea sp.]